MNEYSNIPRHIFIFMLTHIVTSLEFQDHSLYHTPYMQKLKLKN